MHPRYSRRVYVPTLYLREYVLSCLDSIPPIATISCRVWSQREFAPGAVRAEQLVLMLVWNYASFDRSLALILLQLHSEPQAHPYH